MLNAIIEFSIRRRALVLLLTLGVTGAGIWSAVHLHIDAVPDITPVQVQINTAAPALAPEEIEQQITIPIESRMTGMPGLVELRSLSRPGLSQVTMTFADGADVYRLRQLVLERLLEAAADLPAGAQPALAPISTGLGDICYYAIQYAPDAPDVPADAYERLLALSLIHEFTVKPQLRATPGLAEVNTAGGYRKEILVQPDPHMLAELDMTVAEFADRLRGSFANAGGGLLEIGGEQVVVRARVRLDDIAEIARLPLRFAAATEPVLVGDVAAISVGSGLRSGASTVNGEEAVVGVAIMLAGENSRIVARAVVARLREIEQRLPPGVRLVPLYDRGELIDATIATVRRNLTHGALLVIAVLFLLLGRLRAALIVAAVIPLAMLAAFIAMRFAGISGNLMSLGAIDFGLIVSGSVIIVENCIRRLDLLHASSGRAAPEPERRAVVLAASREVAGPLFYGVAIITLVYTPILALRGIEGRMFQPMALTVMFALGCSLLLALTYAPALCSWLPAGGHRGLRGMAAGRWRRFYRPLLHASLRFPVWVAAAAAALFTVALLIFPRLGAEFIPQLDEGSISIQMVRGNSVGIQTSLDLQCRAEQLLLREFPEIRHIFSRLGTAEIATDPMGPNVADTYVLLHPPATWRRSNGRQATKHDLIAAMRQTLEDNIPGQVVLFTQPIQLRFNEILAGARADIAVKIHGADFAELEHIAFAARDVLRTIPGGGDVEFDAIGRIPMLEIVPRRAVMRRLNVHPDEISRATHSALAGARVGHIVEDNRSFPVIVRLAETLRHNRAAIGDLPVRTGDGGIVGLARVAELQVQDRVGNITREMMGRRATILVNLRGRDVQGFVAEATKRLADEIDLPPGYGMEFGGQFENLQRARERLTVVVPLALCLIFLLIYLSVGNLRQALMVFSAVPLAITGGIFFLWWRGIPFSISAGVGFVALSGIAVLDALVLVNCFNDLRRQGAAIRDAVIGGAMLRLRPVLMTSLVASLGFVPMALATTTGAEVQRPLATVVIGGIISSTILTLLVLPGLYHWIEQRAEKAREQCSGCPF